MLAGYSILAAMLTAPVVQHLITRGVGAPDRFLDRSIQHASWRTSSAALGMVRSSGQDSENHARLKKS